MKNEENSGNDINIRKNKKKAIFNNILFNENKNITQSKKIFNNELNNNYYKNMYTKGEDISNNSNIVNNYINKKIYNDVKKSMENTCNDEIDDLSEQKNKNDEMNKETFNYNNKQINKSKSYFIDNNNLNKYKNKKEFFELNNTQNIISNINDKTASNYKKNVNIFNQNNRDNNTFKIKNKKASFKHKIYNGLENNGRKYLANNLSDKDSSDSLSIDDLINKVNYHGDKDNFAKYMEELKLKADITTIVQNMFKNEINSYDRLNIFLENYSKEKYVKILNMYKFLLGRLIQMNQNESNDKEIDGICGEIYSYQHN